MAFSSRRITVNPSGADWLNPKSIDLRWPPSSLSAKSGAGVQILLHGYKESDSGLVSGSTAAATSAKYKVHI